MKHSTATKMTTACGLLALVVSAGASAHGGGGWGGMHDRDRMGARVAQGYGSSEMMPGRGSGAMSGHGHMGPGMMGGYGPMAPGMMGPGMMGPNMMGGYGPMAPGMVPGGMMRGGIGPYEAGVLGLSDEQRRELESIQRENAREHWQLMQQMRDRRLEMMRLYRQGAPDPDAVGEAYAGMAEAQRRMLEQQARQHNRMREVLTEEQRQRLDAMQRFGWEDEDEN